MVFDKLLLPRSATQLASRHDPALDAPAHPGDDLGRIAARDPRRFLSRLKLEATIFLLLLGTFAAVQYQDLIVSKKIVLTPKSSEYLIYSYGDQTNNGTSTVEMNPTTPLRWSCDIGDGYEYPYCGYGLQLDKSSTGLGVDLSSFQTMTIVMTYTGSAEKVRLGLKNRDRKLAQGTPNDVPSELEIPIGQGLQKQVVKFDDFVIAAWWLAANKVPEELSTPQFDNVTALEIVTAGGTKVGRHEFQIKSITLDGASFSQARWYLLILGFWVVLVGGFLVHRILNLRKEFEHKQLQQELESRQLQIAKAAAESASKAKSDFLANMSHELRTPLNAILGYAQLLERGGLNEKHALAARTIRGSGTHLLALITDILDVSKIEAGKFELHPVPFDLRACLEGIADMMRVGAQENGLSFICLVPTDLPRRVVGDEKRLRQVLINIMANAVKFTTQGEVLFEASVIASNAIRSRIRFEVRDTGPGIAADKLPLIFQPFEQAGDAQRRSAGAGLGLSISRKLVELMQGEIQVESRLGEGSRFWFEVDFRAAAAQGPAPLLEAPRLVSDTGASPEVLIVDDIAANRALLAEAIGPLGVKVTEASSGGEALERVLASVPDLILMDVRMPTMDGYETIRKLRADESAAAVPIIALSASATAEVEAQSLDAGADAFIPKPVDDELLIKLVAEHLRIAELPGGQLPAKAEPSVTAPIPPPRDQIEILLKLAMAGNMRAISNQADQIIALDERYRPFAEQLQQLARSYQSPAILRLIRQHSETMRAA